MLSITDLLDFIDLDRDTVDVVNCATGLPREAAATLASQLLATADGLALVHRMYCDQIADATAKADHSRHEALCRAYAQFSRKYPTLKA